MEGKLELCFLGNKMTVSHIAYVDDVVFSCRVDKDALFMFRGILEELTSCQTRPGD